MSRGVNLSDLAALVNDANLVSGAEIDPYEIDSHRLRHENRYSDMLQALRDLESSYSGSGQPTRKPQGKRFYDTDVYLLKLYHTAAGTPGIVLMPADAYLEAMSTAGTATFKPGGPINVNTTVANGSGSSADLMTYAIPASTLGADGAALAIMAVGTSGGGSVDSAFGATTMGTPGIGTNTTFLARFYISRTAAAVQKIASYSIGNRDDTGGTVRVEYTAGAEALGSAVTFKLVGASGTAQQVMLTRLLN